MDELIEQFAAEAKELVQQASEDLLTLEQHPNDSARLESAFRAIHTLKGSVGLFDLPSMQDVLHQAEDLLSRQRGAGAAVDEAAIDLLLGVLAWVDGSIDTIADTGRLSASQESEGKRILSLIRPEPGKELTLRSGNDPDAAPAWAVALRDVLAPAERSRPLVAIRYEPHPECFFSGDDPVATIGRVPDLVHLEMSLRQPASSVTHYDPFRCDLRIEAVSGAGLDDIERLFRLIPDQIELHAFSGTLEFEDRPPIQAAGPLDRQSATVRVDAERIDRLVSIAGELVMAKNAMAPLAGEALRDGNAVLARNISASHAEMDRLVATLYSAVTKARMIPFEQTFRRFPRLVRDTARRLGKSVELVIEGGSVEADREIVEKLFDPLLHLIRNGLDHGIETAAGRTEAAKPAKGRLFLRARKKGDLVEIELADDGAGIDADRIRAKALSRGLLSRSETTATSDKDILQFVFAPGFSTASVISDLSGRGVGLDVVRRTVEELGGAIELRSTLGVGTSFVLSLPISFSMAQLMIVEAGGENYAIPIGDIQETHRLPQASIQSIRAGSAFVLRDKTVPLLYLAELLNIPSGPRPDSELKVLIVSIGQTEIGLAVDAIGERMTTLTRPLSGILKGLGGVSATTLLGDGRIVLVLDIEELLS